MKIYGAIIIATACWLFAMGVANADPQAKIEESVISLVKEINARCGLISPKRAQEEIILTSRKRFYLDLSEGYTEEESLQLMAITHRMLERTFKCS